MLTPRVDAEAIAGRASRIVRYPDSEWEAVAHEDSSPRGIYESYVLPLVAVPVVAKFLGSLVFGTYVARIGTVRPGFFQALLVAALHAALWVGVIQVTAIAAARLAPSFGGRDDPGAALRLAAYSFTPALLAGTFMLVPPLSFACLAGLYGAWLGYRGAPALMGVDQAQAPAYTALVGGAAATLSFVALTLVSILSR